jgi:hypothetical protein
MPDLEISTRYDPAWAAAGMAARQAALAGALRALHRAILAYFVEDGSPPGGPWLHAEAGRHGLDPEGAFAALAAADLVHLDGTGGVAVAYPFSAAPSGYRVQLDGTPPVWAMCAIDALGIPQMAGRDGVITAADPLSGEPVHVGIRDGRWAWQPPETLVLWAHAATGEPAAACACPHIHFVTSEHHARAYLSGHQGLTGGLVGQPAAIALAGAVFGPLLPDPAARPDRGQR